VSKTYTVEVARSEDPLWRDSRNITLGISVGQHYHEGGKFQATVDWVGKYFTSCSILVCDSLHRFNERAYYVGARDQALQAAIDSGTDWLKRNHEALASIKIPVSITRWEDWRLHPDYEAVHREIERVFDSDSGMQGVVAEGIEVYIDNQIRKGSFDQSEATERRATSASYLIEELAGLTLFARRHGTLEAYAGSKILALDYLRASGRTDLPEPLLKIRSIKINLRERRDSGLVQR
jgi:tRNA-dependent cyclodipeptide synthase